MRDIVLTDVERIVAFGDAERTFLMTEDTFRVFYEQTAKPVWAYLARTSGDARLADDLLQETYYRFLRTRTTFESDDHRRNYLFRIATNLVRDHRRRPARDQPLDEGIEPAYLASDSRVAERTVRRLDLSRAMAHMKPRERSLLWLAYAQGCSHEEIASIMGLRKGSLKALLFRARQRLLAFLNTDRARGGQHDA